MRREYPRRCRCGRIKECRFRSACDECLGLVRIRTRLAEHVKGKPYKEVK
jgi:hypothetical protein